MARRRVGEGRQVRLGTIYAAHGASHGFVLVLPSVLITLRAEFGASFTTLGAVATVSSMLYGLGALPAGLLADRVGAPVLLRVFAGASAVCCVLAALAPGIWWLAAALALLGAAGALYHPSGLAEVTLNAPGGGWELGIHGGWGAAGTVGRAALAVVMFLAAAEGFVFQGFVTFLPAFLAEVGGTGQAAAARGGLLSAAVLLLGVPG